MTSNLQPILKSNKNPSFFSLLPVKTKTQLVEYRKIQARENSKVFEKNLHVGDRRERLLSQESFLNVHSGETTKKRTLHKSLEVEIIGEKILPEKQGIHKCLPKFSENIEVFSRRFKEFKGINYDQNQSSPLKIIHKKLSKSVHDLQNWSILNDSPDIVELNEIKRNVENQLINFKLKRDEKKSSYFRNLSDKVANKEKAAQAAQFKKNMLIKNRINKSFKSSAVIKRLAMMRTTGFVQNPILSKIN